MDVNKMNGVYSWILLTALICRIAKCDKLDGYSFPVYNTTSCPRNQSEWRNRSSDLNCTESNGYMCIPKENITQLLEFCYRYPRIPIEKDICLILLKSTSLVEAYSCKQFRNGCPDKQYWSNEFFEYPSCLSIGSRCFLAEPLCKDEGIASTGPSKTNVYFGSTIINTSLGSTLIPNLNENYTWVIGIFLPIVFILVPALIIIFRREKQKALCERHKEKETIQRKRDISGEREIFNLEEIPFIEYKDKLKESEGNHAAGIYLDGYEVWKTEMSEKYKELSNEERAALFLLLCSNENTFILKNTKTISKRISEMFGAPGALKRISDSIQALQSKGFVSIGNEKVTFASDDVQDETMFDYFRTSWDRSKVFDLDKNVPNYIFIEYSPFIKEQLLKVSLESSVRYFRSQNFEGKGKFVRCLVADHGHPSQRKETSYEEIFTKIISELGRDILIHDILDDKALHSSISRKLKIPEEVLRWDLNSRTRYLEYLKKGKTSIYRARGMIVGCAGAGKTTLLERLQGKSLEDIQKIESTVGLDVHNDIFEVLEKEGKIEVTVRKCEPAIHIKENVPVDDAEKIEEKKLLSILDFGGQCMYYACHQIYLSKRAFYILVIDMSKDLEDVIDEELCDQKDTMFSKWSNSDYLLFWLKSVNCYCGDEAPVILVATHADGKSEQEKNEYYQELIETFPGSSTIKTHLSSDRYFSLSLKKHNGACIESLDELEKRIVEVVKSQKHWGEEIPLDWTTFEKFISDKKETKLQELDKLKESFDELLLLSRQEFKDLLRFYHDIGVILYFSFKKPRMNDDQILQIGSDIVNCHDNQPHFGREIVILDIQWFVNSFKYVMTDSKQASFNKVIDAAPTREALDTFTTTGEISGTFLKAIWTVTKNQTAIEYKDDMMKYMEQLGLMAIEEKSDICFIPSMNRMKVPEHVKSKIHTHPNKSPTLYIRFPVLPVFLFYRLIVLCLKRGWKPLSDGRKCIYIDTAMFYFEEHVLVLGVSKSYIQLILYNDDQKQEESIQMAFSKVKREVIKMLSSLTKTFISDLHYQVGYSCKPTEFGKELGNSFLKETDLLDYHGKKCPLHALAEDHGVGALILFLEIGRIDLNNEHKMEYGRCKDESVLQDIRKGHKMEIGRRIGRLKDRKALRKRRDSI